MISTHVLDTGRGEPARGVRVQLFAGDELLADRETDDDGRIRDLADVKRGRTGSCSIPPLLLPQGRGRARDRGRPRLPRPAPPLAVRVRDLPRQLSAEQLAELFEGDTALVRRLASIEDPLGRGAGHRPRSPREGQAGGAERPPRDRRTHEPLGQIGRRAGADAGAEVLQELARLNREYEERFGFRFVVFVDRRPKGEILEVLRQRIRRTREEELTTAVEELVAIAENRGGSS